MHDPCESNDQRLALPTYDRFAFADGYDNPFMLAPEIPGNPGGLLNTGIEMIHQIFRLKLNDLCHPPPFEKGKLRASHGMRGTAGYQYPPILEGGGLVHHHFLFFSNPGRVRQISAQSARKSERSNKREGARVYLHRGQDDLVNVSIGLGIENDDLF